MAQIDCFELLKELANTGKHDFITTKQIQNELRNKGLEEGTIRGVHDDMLRLWACGYVHMKSKSLWDRLKTFKIKKKYI